MRQYVLVVMGLLVLASCTKYSPDEQAAVDAYTHARKVFLARDYEAVKSTLTSERLQGIESMMTRNGKSFNEIMESIQSYVPAEVKVTKVTMMSATGAFLNLEGSRDGKTIQGNSFVKKEDGAWKVDNENWFWKGIPKK